MESKQSRKPGRRITLVCGFHYVKLVYRALLLFAAVLLYIITRVKGMTLPTYFPPCSSGACSSSGWSTPPR